MYLAGPDFQSVLDMNSLLKLNTVGDHIKEDRDGNSQGYETLNFTGYAVKPGGKLMCSKLAYTQSFCPKL